MEQLPQGVRERLAASQGARASTHPDADTLNAFAENALLASERERVLSHLAACADCREIVALSLPQEVTVETAPVAVAPFKPGWFRWDLFRWVGVAAAVVVVSAVALLYRSKTIGEPQVDVVSAPVAAPAPVPQQQAQIPADVVPKAVPTISPQEKPGDAARDRNLGLAKSAGDTSASKKVGVSEGSVKQNETVEVPGHAPVAADNVKSFAVAAEQSRQNVIGGIVAAPSKSQTEARPPALHKAAGGMQLQSVQVQPMPVQTPQAAPPAPTANRARTRESATFAGTYSDSANNAANAPTGNAANSPNAAAAGTSTDTFANNAAVGGAMPNAAPNNAAPGTSAELRNLVVESAAPRAAMALARSVAWRITDTGTVERSLGNGVWQPASPASNIQFRTVSTVGRDVWAGGNNGVLYRSTDAGSSWARIKVSAGAQKLTGDVVHIDLHNARDVDVTTSNGQTWTTRDGGNTWQAR